MVRESVIYRSRKIFNMPDGLGIESTRTYVRNTFVVTTAAGGLIVGSLTSFIPTVISSRPATGDRFLSVKTWTFGLFDSCGVHP
jgi:hypothetical protein